MTSPVPNNVTPVPQAGPPRASQILAAINTRPSSLPSPNVITGVLLALGTFGVAPALLWPRRMRQAVLAERNVAEQVARWCGRHAADREAAELARQADQIQYPAVWLVAAWIGAGVAVIGLLQGLVQVAPGASGLAWLLGMSWRFDTDGVHAQQVGFGLWAGGLCLAQAAHLLGVVSVHRRLHCFADQFNVLALRECLAPVRPGPLKLTLPWVAAGVFLLALHAPWSLFFALAGSMDRRYRRRVAPALRLALADRVRGIVLNNPPAPRAVVADDGQSNQCYTPGCGGQLRGGAKFCPRCGAKRRAPAG